MMSKMAIDLTKLDIARRQLSVAMNWLGEESGKSQPSDLSIPENR